MLLHCKIRGYLKDKKLITKVVDPSGIWKYSIKESDCPIDLEAAKEDKAAEYLFDKQVFETFKNSSIEELIKVYEIYNVNLSYKPFE